MRIIPEEELYDEEIERRAQVYFEAARAEGSLLRDDDLMTEARALAERDILRVRALADQELDNDDDEE
jgi:hypothetical protein